MTNNKNHVIKVLDYIDKVVHIYITHMYRFIFYFKPFFSCSFIYYFLNMGCCASVEQGQGARVRNDQIEQQLRMEKLNEKNEVKLLLLGEYTHKLIRIIILILFKGAGESGKSTILKQMKLIHDGGFPLEEREAHKEIIFNNALQSILVILEAMCNLGIELGDPKNKIHFDNIMRYETQVDNFTMPPDLVEGIKALWQDSGVQETFRRSNEYQLNDSAS